MRVAITGGAAFSHLFVNLNKRKKREEKKEEKEQVTFFIWEWIKGIFE
ncbi:hypothetical protein LSPH26S_01484 [Lysinibacillus sphaericus]